MKYDFIQTYDENHGPSFYQVSSKAFVYNPDGSDVRIEGGIDSQRPDARKDSRVDIQSSKHVVKQNDLCIGVDRPGKCDSGL